MKKCVLYIFVLLLVSACGNSYEEQKRLTRAERERIHHEDSLALKVAVMPTLDCLPLFVARERIMYDTTRLDLRLRYFTAQMDCDTAVTGKSVEGLVSDLVRTERLKQAGIPLDYMTSTNAYWQLVANYRARIKRPAQLGDKMVAMTRYSATDLLTDLTLDGVKTSSVVFRIQVNDVNIRLAMLLNNEMDAMWLTEPQATVARLAGNRKIDDSRDRKLNLGVVAFRHDITKDSHRQTQLKEFSKAYNEACDSINVRGIAHYRDILSKYYKLSDKTISALPKLKFNKIERPGEADIKAARTCK